MRELKNSNHWRDNTLPKS